MIKKPPHLSGVEAFNFLVYYSNMSIETDMYFGGRDSEEGVPEFVPETYSAELADKTVQDLDGIELDLREKIDIDKENKFKKEQAPKQEIPEGALPIDVKYAEEVQRIDEQKLDLVKKAKKAKTPPKKKGQFLGSFFGF